MVLRSRLAHSTRIWKRKHAINRMKIPRCDVVTTQRRVCVCLFFEMKLMCRKQTRKTHYNIKFRLPSMHFKVKFSGETIWIICGKFPIKNVQFSYAFFCLDFVMFTANFLIESSTFCFCIKFVAGCLVHLVPPKLKRLKLQLLSKPNGFPYNCMTVSKLYICSLPTKNLLMRSANCHYASGNGQRQKKRKRGA